jgi:hypothetical protein
VQSCCENLSSASAMTCQWSSMDRAAAREI